MNRGTCVRVNNDDAIRYSNPAYTLESLNSLRSGKYHGATSVLALLPAIDTFLGASTVDIRCMLMVAPFGAVRGLYRNSPLFLAASS